MFETALERNLDPSRDCCANFKSEDKCKTSKKQQINCGK